MQAAVMGVGQSCVTGIEVGGMRGEVKDEWNWVVGFTVHLASGYTESVVGTLTSSLHGRAVGCQVGRA